jgi:hypothetical protein
MRCGIDGWPRSQPDRACGVRQALDAVVAPVREPERGDTRGGDRVAQIRHALEGVDPTTEDGDTAERLAGGKMQDAFDLGPGDRERDPLEH